VGKGSVPVKISFILPACNEEDHIASVIRALLGGRLRAAGFMTRK